jgi:deoxyadenosine/deoxycytidine kinase
MLYDSGDLEPIMYKIYNEWVSSFSEIKPSKMIYLKTSSSICYLRIASRNRQGEDLIPIDYIERCKKKKENMIKSVSGEVDVITLNGNIDIFKLGSFNEWTKDISDFVEDIYHISDYIINV